MCAKATGIAISSKVASFSARRLESSVTAVWDGSSQNILRLSTHGFWSVTRILIQRQLDSGISAVGLDYLLQKSDIVTLHVSLSDRTRSFFGKEQFSRMKAGAWFINTARGELIDEMALLDALRSGRLAGAALDVLCERKFQRHGMHHPLVAYAREHDNLLITPHIGGCTVESMEKTEVFMANKLLPSSPGRGR